MTRIFADFRFSEFEFEDWIANTYERYRKQFPALMQSEVIALVQAYAALAGSSLALEFFGHDLSTGGVMVKNET